MDLTTARNRAINKFNKLSKKDIECPALWKKVKFSNEGFSHITYKDKKHRRNDNEQIVRFQCFLNVETLIRKSHLYQEHRIKQEEIKERKYWKTTKVIKQVEYFWLVGIVEHHKVKSRIRVVLRLVEWKEKAEYHSVIPAWNMKGYRNFNWPLK